MKHSLSLCIFALAGALSPSLMVAQKPAAAPAVRADAREMIPPALIGSWKLSLADSKYADPAKAPKMQYRIFDYTADGMLLSDYITAAANGSMASGNWTTAFDEIYRPEYTRNYGSTPFAMVQLLKKDDHTFDLKATKHGVVFESGEFVLSADGDTLTFTYLAGDAKNIAVYHRWNLLN